MDSREGEEPSRFVMDEILPPRLEDAGLEDCALPIDSIHEAFLKAASAVGSLGESAFTSDEDGDDDVDVDVDEEEDTGGPEAPEKSSGSSYDPPPVTSHASDVEIKSECAAEDGKSNRSPMRADAGEDEEPCAVGLQKLEIR